MKHKLWILLLFIICCSSVYGYEYVCSGDWDVAQPCLNAIDGDWGTYADDTVAAGSAYLCLNYTIPPGHKGKINASWKNSVGTYNSTWVPGCTTNPLQIRMVSNNGGNTQIMDCLNSGTCSGSADYARFSAIIPESTIYEFELIFNITHLQITSPANNSDLTTKNLNLWLNSSLENGEQCVLWRNESGTYTKTGDTHQVGINKTDSTQKIFFLFNSNTTALNKFNISQNGTFFGSPKLREGRTAGSTAVQFETSGTYLSVNDNLNSSVNTSHTLTGWILLNKTTAWDGIIEKYQGGGIRWGFNNANKIRYLLRDGVGAVQDDQYSTNTLSLNQWYFITLTYNGTHKVIYINGTQDSSVSYTAGISLNSVALEIGRTGGANYFNGSIMEIAVYNETWNVSRILTEYNADRRLYWNVNDSDFTDLTEDTFTYQMECNSSTVSTTSPTYYFTVDNINETIEAYYSNPIFYGTTYQYYTLQLKSVFGAVPTGNLTYNGTTYTAFTLSNTTPHNYNLTFNVTLPTIPSEETNYSFSFDYAIGSAHHNTTQTYNQSVYTYAVDNCSTYAMQAINFTLRNKTTDASTPGSMEGHFIVYLTDGYSKRFNLTWDNNGAEYGICIYPNISTYRVDASLFYTNASRTRTYYFVNASLDNSTEEISLYFVDGTTQTLFYVIDELDNDVPSAYIKVKMYDLATDTDQVVEIIKTDDEGSAVGNIIWNTQQYRFIVEKDSVTIFSSQPTIITATPRTFRVRLGADYFSDYQTVQKIGGIVTFNNDTKVFSYTFSDPSSIAREGCLVVTRRTRTGDQVINNSCVTSSSSTISLSIASEPEFTQTYTGVGTIVVSDIKYVVDQEVVRFDMRYKSWGEEGLFMTAMLVGSLAMIGVSFLNPVIAVVFLVVGFIGAIFMTLFWIGWPALMAYIIIAGVSIYFLARNK